MANPVDRQAGNRYGCGNLVPDIEARQGRKLLTIRRRLVGGAGAVSDARLDMQITPRYMAC